MGPLMRVVASAAAAYAVGTIPSAAVVTRLVTRGRTDIRTVGTGNPGAANVAMVLGRRWAAVVLAADIAKGFAGARLGGRIAGSSGLHSGGPAAVAGHCFPIWQDFNGGKGVATSGGQVLATFPLYLPIDASVAFLTTRVPALERKAFAATEVASLCWILTSALWWRRRLPNPGAKDVSVGLPLAAAATSAIIRYRFIQTNSQVDAWRARDQVAVIERDVEPVQWEV